MLTNSNLHHSNHLGYVTSQLFGVGYLPTLETGRWLKTVEFEAILAASAYSDEKAALDLLHVRQVAALFTKNASVAGSTDAVRSASALDKFEAVERYQRLVTKRIKWFSSRPGRLGIKGQVLSQARLDLFRLLGPAPSGEEILTTLEQSKFGPGSVGGVQQGNTSSQRKLKDVTPFGKLSDCTQIWVTAGCLQYWGRHLNGAFKDWLSTRKSKIVQHCSGALVPKDASTDRFIAVEPYLNSYIQLGQMAMLNKYLRRWGIDTRLQEPNQELAHRASLPENAWPHGWSTLDLTSASDSVNFELVRWLLPPGWFDYLNSTRSPAVKLPQNRGTIALEKFSSMGNGITFPLETLIFSALIRACRTVTGCQQEWRVYGDDLIVSHRITPLLMEVLGFCGFRLNADKSFVHGYFRESCGKDYLGGHSVRPIYLKGSLSEDDRWYALCNSLQQVDTPTARRLYAILRESRVRPLIGPSTTPTGITTTHLVAPMNYLRSRGLIHWDREYQSWVGVFPRLVEVRREVTRKEKRAKQAQAYLAWLAQQMRSDPHPVRVSVPRFSVRVVIAKNLFWLNRYDLSWNS